MARIADVQTTNSRKVWKAITLGIMLAAGAPVAFAWSDEPSHGAAHADNHAAPAHDSIAPAHAEPASHDDKPATVAITKNDSKPEPKAQTPAKPAKTKPAPSQAAKKKPAPEPAEAGVSASDALKLLQEGNERWVNGKSMNPSTDASRRTEQAEGQTPFVSVLTCADSRIPLERVFDRGVGEIFAVRVAGNVAGDSELGTLEYGVGHLKTKLLVVMGHTKCGAVAACASGAKLHGKVAELVSSIQPAVERAKRANPSADDKEVAALAVKENVWQTIYTLMQSSEELRGDIESGDVQVVGAIYDVASGKVEFLGEHPWQRELIAAAKANATTTAAASDEGEKH